MAANSPTDDSRRANWIQIATVGEMIALIAEIHLKGEADLFKVGKTNGLLASVWRGRARAEASPPEWR